MSARDLHVYTREQLRKKTAAIKAQVDGGKCKDFPEYKQMTGRLTGIEESISTLDAAMRKYHSGDIDDDEEDGDRR